MNILFIFVKKQVAFGSYLGWRLPYYSHEFTRDPVWWISFRDLQNQRLPTHSLRVGIGISLILPGPPGPKKKGPNASDPTSLSFLA